MSQPPTPFPVGSGTAGLLQQCARDLRAELSGLSSQLHQIPGDQIGAGARHRIDTALRHAEAMDRLIGAALAQLAGVTSPADTAPLRGGFLAGRRVVLADDEGLTLRFLSELFASEGASVITARSGAEAMEALAAGPCDLLVTDATMPGLSGAQVIRALRASPPPQGSAPALAMTTDISVRRYDELIAAGASRVVTKPLPGPTELLRIVERLLRSPLPAAAMPDNAPLFDPAPLTRVCQLAGPELGREILDRLILDLVETMARLDRVSAGLKTGSATEPELADLRSTTCILIALAGTAGALQLLRQVQALDHRLQDGPQAWLPPDLGALLSDIRVLTRGAVTAIARMPLPAAALDAP